MSTNSIIKSAHILVVDDDQISIDTIKSIFNTFEPDFTVDGLTNPLKIKSYFSQLIPDLIICDWQMPEMNGLEIIKFIRSQPKLNLIPIVITTGIMTSSENLSFALEAGANDFMRKPFDKTELMARVKSMLHLSKFLKEIHGYNQAINEYSRFISSIMSSIPTPVIYFNTEGVIINCNETFLETFGFANNDTIGAEFYDLYPGFDRLKEMSEKILQNNLKHSSYELMMILPPKKEITFLVTQTSYYNPLETPEGFVCVFSDITELKDIHHKSIEEKKRELVSSAMRMIHMSETNDKLMHDLETLTKHIDSGGKELLNQISSRYRMRSLDLTWKEFEMRFEKVYEDFYIRLSKIHPNLTSGDKKISALLRLNLTSKEIAAITFQDAKSIDMARYRLRKKLNLSTENSLVEYLSKI
jgi:PAS domain S-box-containing protein